MGNTYYCTVTKAGLRTVIHMSDLETLKVENHRVQTVEEVEALIAQSGATHINFYYTHLPARPVAVDHPKLTTYIKSALRLTQPRQPRPGGSRITQRVSVSTLPDDFDPSEYIDNN